MQPYRWTCSTCGNPTTITEPNHTSGVLNLACRVTSETNGIRIRATLIECPNPDCLAQDFSVAATHGKWARYDSGVVVAQTAEGVGIGHFKFLPITGQPLSSYVPLHVLQDYAEAYLIKDLSPKASATLARRALQGMVRDFFKLRKLRSLHHELEAIEGECDPDLYGAMMAVKSVGNIGAHPEQDVSVMVDVEEGEPKALLDLIHLLDQEWYVARAERAARVARMKALGADKAQAKAGVLPAPEAPTLLFGPADRER